MTPREVFAAIEAATWRMMQAHAENAWLAWHTAALERSKRMPSLKELVDPPKTQVLTPEEAKQHREDFEMMKNALPERLRKGQ